MPDAEGSPIIPKTEHSREASLSSIESSPGPDVEADLEGHQSAPANVQVQKRKGGRKPIYATSEERKQRNRQAQAAFRERRTEYIKQLETTIKHQDEQLQTLQQSHRSAADECLMLRYKNSLLERILLEKGIDVNAELKTKDIAAPGKIPSSLPQPSPIQRAVMNRHNHAHRASTGSAASLIQKSSTTSGSIPNHSPQLQPTPSSQTSSPSTSRSPIFGVQGGMNPPNAGFQAQQQQQPQQLKGPPYPGISIPASTIAGLQPIAPTTAASANALKNVTRPNHWPSPFQTHMEQLEQEYDAHADMLDDPDPADEAPGPGPYPQPTYSQSQSVPAFTAAHHPELMAGQGSMHAGDNAFGNSNGQIFDPFDPMLDADPFGLTASMHFPTQFSFQESSMRK